MFLLDAERFFINGTTIIVCGEIQFISLYPSMPMWYGVVTLKGIFKKTSNV